MNDIIPDVDISKSDEAFGVEPLHALLVGGIVAGISFGEDAVAGPVEEAADVRLLELSDKIARDSLDSVV